MERFLHSLLQSAKKTKDLKTIEGLYNGNKNDPIIKFEYAKMLIYYGHYSKAKEYLLELLDSRNADYAMLELARLERSIGNTDKAREYYNILAAKNDRVALFNLGKLEVDQCNLLEAKKIFTSLANSDRSGLSRIELGKVELNLGNIEKAKGHFRTAMNVNKTAAARIALGKTERNLGNFDEARKWFKSAFEVNNDISGLYELGRLEFAIGNKEEARKVFTSLLTKYNSDQANIDLGRLEASLGNNELAKKHFLALRGKPTERFALYSLLALCVKEKNYEEAFKYAKDAVSRGVWISGEFIIDIGKNLNVFLDVDFDKYPFVYSVKQLIDYDEYVAMGHIEDRHINASDVGFTDDIDVYKLFNSIKDQLTEEHLLDKLHFNDVYMIPYKNAGVNGEGYIKVITLPNTKDIITMYPIFSMYDHISENEESYSSLTR